MQPPHSNSLATSRPQDSSISDGRFDLRPSVRAHNDEPDAYTLKRRWRRATRLFNETRTKLGWRAAVIIASRLVLRKTSILVRHVWAFHHTSSIRAGVARHRVRESGKILVAFAISGGLGDNLVIARFIRDLCIYVGEIEFDVYSPTQGLTAWAFTNVPGFRSAFYDISFGQVAGDYDVAFRLNQAAVVHQELIHWHLVRRNHKLMSVIDNLVRFRPKVDAFISQHPWLDNFLARMAVFAGGSRRDFLHLMAGICYSGDKLVVPVDASVVDRLGLGDRPFVTVHNGFDPGYVISRRRATKCYPHFDKVITHLKTIMPHMIFVQIGTTSTSEPIPACDLLLLGRTSLDEAAGLISQAAMHLDNEGGLVHLAACLGVRSAVVFGPTPSDYFGYHQNINIEPPICGGCWYMTRTWMDACPKGHDTPICLTEQEPRTVAERVFAALAEPAFPGACDIHIEESLGNAHSPDITNCVAFE